MKYWIPVLYLRQYICEWFHTHHWKGFPFEENEHQFNHMNCKKCGRWWSERIE